MTPPTEVHHRQRDPAHEELVVVRELLTILVVLAVTGALYLMARASVTF